MKIDDLVLAILPPLGALLVERLDLLDLKYLMADADRTLHDESWAEDKISESDVNVIKEIVAYSAAGASEIAGLAPTFVSAITSGFAVLKEIQRWLWPTAVYIISVMIITLLMIKLLRGLTCHAIAEQKIPIPLISWMSKNKIHTRKQVASWCIYGINMLLISLAVSVYMWC